MWWSARRSAEFGVVAEDRAAQDGNATGWATDSSAIYRYSCDAVFPLSDHADFADLLRFVEMVQPKRVLTVHGYVEEFARTLRERGVEAWALGVDNQMDLDLRGVAPEEGGIALGMTSSRA